MHERPKATETLARAEKRPTPTPVDQPSSLKLAATPAKIQTDGTKLFAVQVASLVVKQNALNLIKRLEEHGYTPVIHKTTAPISRHRVYAGEFSSREEAEQVARRLNVDGFPSNLVEGEDGMFRPEVGSSYDLNKAIDLAHTLQEKKYSPKIVSKGVPTPVYQVRVGEFGSRAQALKALEALKKQGFTPIIVRK
ncbi:MAG: SPOR domain-containing protein [Candidatus Methylomirabilales bacterium]